MVCTKSGSDDLMPVSSAVQGGDDLDKALAENK